MLKSSEKIKYYSRFAYFHQNDRMRRAGLKGFCCTCTSASDVAPILPWPLRSETVRQTPPSEPHAASTPRLRLVASKFLGDHNSSPIALSISLFFSFLYLPALEQYSFNFSSVSSLQREESLQRGSFAGGILQWMNLTVKPRAYHVSQSGALMYRKQLLAVGFT
jgi:hypothetical protein